MIRPSPSVPWGVTILFIVGEVLPFDALVWPLLPPGEADAVPVVAPEFCAEPELEVD